MCAPSDGVAVLRCFNEVYDYSAGMPTPSATSGKAVAPVKVQLEVPSSVAATCKQAGQDFDQVRPSALSFVTTACCVTACCVTACCAPRAGALTAGLCEACLIGIRLAPLADGLDHARLCSARLGGRPDAGFARLQVRESLQTSILEVPGFTSGYISSKGLGLDGVLQMSFQLAHFQLHGHSASTYESANQSAYKHGRTETVPLRLSSSSPAVPAALSFSS
jgi:hypothetical protein